MLPNPPPHLLRRPDGLPRLLLLGIGLLLLAPGARAHQTEVCYTFARVSPSGEFIFKLIAPEGTERPAAGQMYRIEPDGQLCKLWELRGWYDTSIYVAGPQLNLAIPGAPSAIKKLQKKVGKAFPLLVRIREDIPSVVFYRHGKQAKTLCGPQLGMQKTDKFGRLWLKTVRQTDRYIHIKTFGDRHLIIDTNTCLLVDPIDCESKPW
mgnify:CR=1 FL=1